MDDLETILIGLFAGIIVLTMAFLGGYMVADNWQQMQPLAECAVSWTCGETQ